MSRNSARRLRSQDWFGQKGGVGTYIRRNRFLGQGYPPDSFDGRPIIGICNSWSGFNPCNGHLRELAQYVANGVYEAGGFPLEFPVMSLGETSVRPTTMLYRNLVAMEVEESLRANPIDGVVLLVGCDKTTPALLMGAASRDTPTIALSGGPMLNGYFRGEMIGTGTHTARFAERLTRGAMTPDDLAEAAACTTRSTGTCNTMGTASTMACLVEAIGVGLPQNAAIPAVDARRSVLAHEAGRRIVSMVREDVRISKILTREAFENAIRTVGAIGGSTNAVIHLLALAGRVGVHLVLDDWDTLGKDVPCLVNLMPSGEHLMEDFYYAGGLPAVLRELGENGLLHKDVLTANGRTLWENVRVVECYNRDVIRPFSAPYKKQGGLAVLRGNLAPSGAIIKPSAATPSLMKHRGPAVVFENIEDLEARIDDPGLSVSKDSVLVLRNCGPKGYPGMGEVGRMRVPAKLLKSGVDDMVRISDARMSGTSFGTVVLHIAPEAAVGGPLALVEDGDMIVLDVEGRQLHLDVSPDELKARGQRWRSSITPPEGGWRRLYFESVTQADRGCDFDFLHGRRVEEDTRWNH